MGSKVKICVLISGNGTNLQALIDALATSQASVPAEICCVISSKGEKAEKQANETKAPYGLERARRAGLPHHRLNIGSLKEFKVNDSDSDAIKEKKRQDGKNEYDRRLAELVLASKPDMVICLGYMRILLPVFLSQLESKDIKIVNLHPALPGEYDGTNAIERAHKDWLDGKISRTGVMIHRVIEAVDAGAVVVKREIRFQPEDSVFTDFESKVHQIEWQLVVEGVEKMVNEIQQSRRNYTAT